MSEESRNLNYTAPRPRPDAGYAFDKWVYEDGTPVDFSTDTVSEYGTVLIAQFIPSDAPYVPQQFTVTFVAGANGTLSGQTVFMVTEGEDGTAPLSSAAGGFKVPTAKSQAGFVLAEWADQDGVVIADLETYAVGKQTTITAKFALDTSMYEQPVEITFIVNGVTVLTDHSLTIGKKVGTLVSDAIIAGQPYLPTTGGKFKIVGWQIDGKGTTYSPGQAALMTISDQKITFVAVIGKAGR